MTGAEAAAFLVIFIAALYAFEGHYIFATIMILIALEAVR